MGSGALSASKRCSGLTALPKPPMRSWAHRTPLGTGALTAYHNQEFRRSGNESSGSLRVWQPVRR